MQSGPEKEPHLGGERGLSLGKTAHLGGERGSRWAKRRVCAAKKGLRAGRAGEGTHERRRPEKGRRILYSMAAPAAAKG